MTGVKEPHFPERKRIPRILSGIAVIIIMVSRLEQGSSISYKLAYVYTHCVNVQTDFNVHSNAFAYVTRSLIG